MCFLINRMEEKIHYFGIPCDCYRNLLQNYSHIRPGAGDFQPRHLHGNGNFSWRREHFDASWINFKSKLVILHENFESMGAWLNAIDWTWTENDAEGSVNNILHQSMRADQLVTVSDTVESFDFISIPSHADAWLWCFVSHIELLNHV